jgi:mRNA interferase RelE/StbE
MWKIVYKSSVRKDFKNISNEMTIIIRQVIEEKLMTDPMKYGTPLRRTLKGYMKLRVGSYRIVYSIEKKTITVYVIKIAHRKDVYRDLE